MKIKNVVCAPGRTGFYFDDQRAIKRGAGHDGMFYIGQPVTEGFSAVRQDLGHADPGGRPGRLR